MAPKDEPSRSSSMPAPRKRGGTTRIPLELQRKSALPPVRVTAAEHDEVRALAKAMGVPMGELIRRAVLGTKVQGVPAVNREIWGRLAPLIANLNHYIRKLRQGKATGVPPEMVEQLRNDVDDLREYLLGRDPKELFQDALPPAAPLPPRARKPKPAAAPPATPARRGRPPGSKNKTAAAPPATPPRRGRPPGSKSKTAAAAPATPARRGRPPGSKSKIGPASKAGPAKRPTRR
jgi:hypothetical protein